MSESQARELMQRMKRPKNKRPAKVLDSNSDLDTIDDGDDRSSSQGGRLPTPRPTPRKRHRSNTNGFSLDGFQQNDAFVGQDGTLSDPFTVTESQIEAPVKETALPIDVVRHQNRQEVIDKRPP